MTHERNCNGMCLISKNGTGFGMPNIEHPLNVPLAIKTTSKLAENETSQTTQDVCLCTSSYKRYRLELKVEAKDCRGSLRLAKSPKN